MCKYINNVLVWHLLCALHSTQVSWVLKGEWNQLWNCRGTAWAKNPCAMILEHDPFSACPSTFVSTAFFSLPFYICCHRLFQRALLHLLPPSQNINPLFIWNWNDVWFKWDWNYVIKIKLKICVIKMVVWQNMIRCGFGDIGPWFIEVHDKSRPTPYKCAISDAHTTL